MGRTTLLAKLGSELKKLSMDLSLLGQSRDAEGRHRAALPGLGPWVGARVASPRGPILRPGPSTLLRALALGQVTAGAPRSPGTARSDAAPRPRSASSSAGPRSAPPDPRACRPV